MTGLVPIFGQLGAILDPVAEHPFRRLHPANETFCDRAIVCFAQAQNLMHRFQAAGRAIGNPGERSTVDRRGRADETIGQSIFYGNQVMDEIRSLTGLRGIAALIVFLDRHTCQPGQSWTGPAGPEAR